MRTALCALLLAAAGFAAPTLVAPVAAADPVDVDVHQDGFLVCVYVTTSHPLPPGHHQACTVP